MMIDDDDEKLVSHAYSLEDPKSYRLYEGRGGGFSPSFSRYCFLRREVP